MSSERPSSIPRAVLPSGSPRPLNLRAQTVGEPAILMSLQPDVDRARGEHMLGRYEAAVTVLHQVQAEAQACLKSWSLTEPTRASFELLLGSICCLLGRAALASGAGDGKAYFAEAAESFRKRAGELPLQRNTSQLWTDYGIVLYRLGDTAQAIEALKQSERTGVPPPETFYFLAAAYRDRAAVDGNRELYVKARESAEKGLQVAPGDAGIYCTLADVLVSLKDVPGAVDSYVNGALGSARKKDLSTTSALLGLSLRLLPGHKGAVTLAVEVERAQKRFDAALKIVDSAVAAHAGPWALAIKGKLLHDVNRIPEAIELLREVPIDHETACVASELASAYFDIGDLDQASTLVERSLSFEPDDGFAQFLKGRLLIETGRAAEAIPILENVVRQDPDSPAVKFELGRAHFACGRFAEAVTMFDEVSRADPGYLPAAVAKAQACFRDAVLLKSKDGFEIALSQARRTLKLDPGNGEMLDLVRDASRQLGREEDALREMEVELARNPKSVRAWYLKGSILLDLEDFAGAAEALEKASEYAPDYADVHIAHANALRLLGRYDQAGAACEKGLRGRPLTPYALGWAGIYFGEVGDFSRACQVLKQGTTGFPDRSWLWGSLGWALQYRDDRSALESIEAYQKAVAADGQRRDIWNEKGLADALYLAGRSAEAEQSFRKLLTEWPPQDNASVTYARGWSLYRLGELTNASELLKQVADSSSYFMFAQFDYALTLLAGGQEGAWAAYSRALAQSEQLDSLRQRGLLYVALFDILEAARRKPMAEGAGSLIDHIQRRLKRAGLETGGMPWMVSPVRQAERSA